MSFWKGKSVLVTGAHGFVGRNLMNLLQEMRRECEFRILSPSRNELDLTKEEQVATYFKEHKPQIVLHLAGKVGGILANKTHPGDFFYQNIMNYWWYLDSFPIAITHIYIIATTCSVPFDFITFVAFMH